MSRKYSLAGSLTFLATAALLITVPAQSWAQEGGIPVRMSARSMAMGGVGLLSSNPIEMGYFNPGGLTLTGGFHFYPAMIQFGGDDDLGTLIEFISDHLDDLENFDPLSPDNTLVQDIEDDFSGRWIGMNVDPMIGIQLGSLAISAYGVSRGNLQLTTMPSIVPGVNEPVLRLSRTMDLVLNAALGLQFGPFLHGGVGVRSLTRYQSDGIEEVAFSDAEGLAGLGSKFIEFEGEKETGMAIDVGGTFTLTNALAVGGVVRGLYASSSVADFEWEPEISGGVRVKPLELLLGVPKILIRDLTLEANIRDLTNTSGESYADKLQIGAEVKLPILFSVRAGLNRGHLSYGAGLHFLLVDLQVAKAFLPSIAEDSLGNLVRSEEAFYAVSIGIGW